MGVLTGFTSFALILSVFMIILLMFGYSKINTNLTLWIIIIIMFTAILSSVTTARRSTDWPVQQSLLIADYTN